MKLLRNNRRLLFTGAALAVLLTVANHWISYYTTPFKLDTGMSGVIYAGQYVKTGKWVFDCEYGRLVSRAPLPPPIAALKKAKRPLKLISAYSLNDTDKAVAIQLVKDLGPDDYEKLKYRFSAQGEDSEIQFHSYYLIKNYSGREWAVDVSQLNAGQYNYFSAAAVPYVATEYVDHEKALKAAAVSCPQPQ
ncbi:hypothetical protein [Pseudomonas xanthosomatis]|uniref:hypothetical protein n=1 Tax=Pseudomonas xanthosomatis TaxID=2842356 RepID=UPI003519ADDE